ncbi:MAG: hypothetical protein NW206_11615 [Hyphomonadaceae bacterium]|nr:hypothetical protein [Hyphomonadaceae bacterium]
MIRRPKNLEDAKAIYKEEKQKVTRSLDAIIGSRVLMAVLATFVIAFAVNLLTSPDQLPNVGGLSIARLGLPPEVDFGFVGEQATQAGQAALREGAPGMIQSFVEENRSAVPIINGVGLGATFVLLLVNMTVMTKRRRFTKG